MDKKSKSKLLSLRSFEDLDLSDYTYPGKDRFYPTDYANAMGGLISSLLPDGICLEESDDNFNLRPRCIMLWILFESTWTVPKVRKSLEKIKRSLEQSTPFRVELIVKSVGYGGAQFNIFETKEKE